MKRVLFCSRLHWMSESLFVMSSSDGKRGNEEEGFTTQLDAGQAEAIAQRRQVIVRYTMEGNRALK